MSDEYPSFDDYEREAEEQIAPMTTPMETVLKPGSEVRAMPSARAFMLRTALGKEYGVDRTLIWQIEKRKLWAHV